MESNFEIFAAILFIIMGMYCVINFKKVAHENIKFGNTVNKFLPFYKELNSKDLKFEQILVLVVSIVFVLAGIGFLFNLI